MKREKLLFYLGPPVVFILILVWAVVFTGDARQGAAAPPATPTALPRVGDTVSSGNWRYTVTRVERQEAVRCFKYDDPTEAKGIWQIVQVRVTNIGTKTYSLHTWDFEINDEAGHTYEAANESRAYSSLNGLSKPGDDYPPNVEAEIGLIFDVDPNAAGLKLNLAQAETLIDLEG